jgi:hypothetical protein
LVGSRSFFECKSLSSITFESNSRVPGIESGAFYESSLKSIVIQRNVEFINGSAFIDVTLSPISIDRGAKALLLKKAF